MQSNSLVTFPNPSAQTQDLKILAGKVREHSLRMTHRANASHIGTSLSMVEILVTLYARILKYDPKRPDWADRDRLIVSKGHGAAAVYAILAECGFFSKDKLESFCLNGGALSGHVTRDCAPGVEVSTGSLGHGLPIGCGIALAGKRDRNDYRTFVIVSDGELDEGSNWEAILFAPHHRLGNLTLIVDYNSIQSFGSVSEVLELEPLTDKFRAFGWRVMDLDGHDFDVLTEALKPSEVGNVLEERPLAIIARTIKGKGVDFMENELQWHYRSVKGEQLTEAIKQVTATENPGDFKGS